MKSIKGLISVGLITAILLSCAVSADYDKEITFRNIPWGSDTESVNKEFDGFQLSESIGTTPLPYTSQLLGYDLRSTENNSIGVMEYVNNLTEGDLQVAGHDIGSVCLYFVGIDKPMLYGATYYFLVDDYEQLCDDLISKLDMLYGSDHEDVAPGEYVDIVGHIWKGRNSTACSLRHDDGVGTVSISYASTFADSIIEDLDDNKTRSDFLETENVEGL